MGTIYGDIRLVDIQPAITPPAHAYSFVLQAVGDPAMPAYRALAKDVAVKVDVTLSAMVDFLLNPPPCR